MITRLTLPIDILHDERIVSLITDCGPESIAVLISLLAIQRRRGSISRDRYLIAKIRHDLSFTLDEAAINAVIDHLIESGYIDFHDSIDSPDSIDSIDTSRECEDAPSSLPPDASIPSFENYLDPFCSDVWPHFAPYTLEEVIGAYRCRYVQQNLEERRKSSIKTDGVEVSYCEDLAVMYYEQFRDSWIESGYPVRNLGRSLSDWILKSAVREARRQAKAAKAAQL